MNDRLIDLARIFFHDDEPPDESLVQIYEERLRKGVAVTYPVLVRKADGRHSPLDEDDRAKVEAAKRCGADSVWAYVIDDPGPEKLQELRRSLEAERLGRN